MFFIRLSYDRQRRLQTKRVFEAARWAAASSRVDMRVREDPASRTPEADYEAGREQRELEEAERLAREREENYVRPPTLGRVGLGLDMMFAPRGAFSMPRYEAPSDNRPLDWMFTSFDDMKPLAEVREELRKEKLVRACSEDMVGIRLPKGLSGRTLFVGESPPF